MNYYDIHVYILIYSTRQKKLPYRRRYCVSKKWCDNARRRVSSDHIFLKVTIYADAFLDKAIVTGSDRGAVPAGLQEALVQCECDCEANLLFHNLFHFIRCLRGLSQACSDAIYQSLSYVCTTASFWRRVWQ